MKRKIVIHEFVTRPSTKLPPASVAKNTQKHCYFLLNRMLVNHRVILTRTHLYSEILPYYGHLGYTVTLLLQPLFYGRLAKTATHFLVKKNLIKTATLLIWPNFFGPLVTLLSEFHCTFKHWMVLSTN